MSIGKVNSQQLSFFSPSFENAVRKVLSLNENTMITSEMTVAISDLDLSNNGLTDIRDIVYFPNITTLDLSNNYIQDISPLVNLAKLTDLNMSNNYLQNIDMLVFTLSKNMYVNASLNYISDFSMIRRDYHCNFILTGEGLQRNLNDLQLVIGTFYSDWDERENPFIVYSTKANNPILLTFAGKLNNVNANNSLQEYYFDESILQPEQVTLTMGDKGDTTYVVPPITQSIKAGSQGRIEIALPVDYTIRVYQNKNPDAIQVDATTILYTAPANFISDTLSFEFRKNGFLKGYSRIYLSNDITGIETILNNKEIEIFPNPAKNEIFIKSDSQVNRVEIYSLAGSLLIIENNLNEKISLAVLPKGIYMIRVYTDNGLEIGKIVKE